MSDSTQKNFLEKLFKLKENNTNIKTEIIAGIMTFMTMSYILAGREIGRASCRERV